MKSIALILLCALAWLVVSPTASAEPRVESTHPRAFAFGTCGALFNRFIDSRVVHNTAGEPVHFGVGELTPGSVGSENRNYYFDAWLDRQGMITFNVRMRGRGGRDDRSQLISGRHEFDEMMAIFGERVQSIRGHWIYGDNLAKLIDLTSNGKMEILEAAAFTWTGQQAARHGFVPTQVTMVNRNRRDQSIIGVDVLFERF